MKKSIIKEIKEQYPSLSKSHKKMADFIIDNYSRAAFLTANALSGEIGISESTVVRFAVEMGFEGYVQFQRCLKEYSRFKLTSAQRMEISNMRFGDDDIIDKVLEMDIAMIRATREGISRENFNLSLRAVNEAKKIYILGIRSSASLAKFLAHNLKFVYDNVVLVEYTGGSEILEQLYRISKDDVCFAISFPRYSKNIINTLSFVRGTGAKVIALTDSEASPIAALADYTLIARGDMVSFIDSHVAPMSVLNAFIAAAASSRSAEVYDNLLALEGIWDEYQIYDKTEGRTADE